MNQDTGQPSFHHGEVGANHPSLFSDGDLAQRAQQTQPGHLGPQVPPTAPQLTGDQLGQSAAPEDGVTFSTPTQFAADPLAQNTIQGLSQAPGSVPSVNRAARNDQLANAAVMGVVGTGIALRTLLKIVIPIVFFIVFIIVVITIIHGANSVNNSMNNFGSGSSSSSSDPSLVKQFESQGYSKSEAQQLATQVQQQVNNSLPGN